MIIHWFLSKTVRQASDMKRQVRSLLNEQRDILKPEAIATIEQAIVSMDGILRANPGKKAVAAEMERLETIANANLRPYPSASMRENVKEIMVAITTIMAFTTFFLQLTKIPTGSMQPTLYGITEENLLDQPEVKIPGLLGRLKDYWVWGIEYENFIAPVDGEFEGSEPARTLLPFVKKQRFRFAGEWHTIWFPADSLFGGTDYRGGGRAVIRSGVVKKGEYVFNVKVVAGDHLLVDRFTYNFRRPERGEIIVFKTRGIQGLPQDQLYIKRLVGLPDEKIQIGNDRHLIVDGRRLDANEPRFEYVYSFDHRARQDPFFEANKPGLSSSERMDILTAAHRKPPYRGHVNDKVARSVYGYTGTLAPQFLDENSVYQIRPKHLLAMGDNTLNSADGRVFGDFDARNLIGKCWFIYWPFTERFGWGYR